MSENITPLPLPLRIDWNKDGYELAVLRDGGGHWIANIEATRNDISNLVGAANAYPALTARVKDLEDLLRQADRMVIWEANGLDRGFQDRVEAALNKEPT